MSTMAMHDISYNPLTDYYEILNVSPDAAQHAIARAYRAAMKKHAVTADGDAYSPEIEAAREAYSVLSHPLKRAVYNSSRNRHGPPVTVSAPSWAGASASLASAAAPR